MKFLNIQLAVLIAISLTIFSCSKDDDCELLVNDATSEVTMIAQDHHSVYTDIIINASTQEVWDVLTDFDNISNWSTSFQGLSGDIQDGGSVVATFLIQDPSTGEINPVDFPHTLTYTEGVQFGWSDPVAVFPGITDNHLYRVEEISECQTRFIQTDEFMGTDTNITTEIFAQVSEGSYNQFNLELKTEVEQ